MEDMPLIKIPRVKLGSQGLEVGLFFSHPFVPCPLLFCGCSLILIISVVYQPLSLQINGLIMTHIWVSFHQLSVSE